MNVGLFDGSFSHQLSATYGGENDQRRPRHINWVRDEFLPVTVFTDMCLNRVYESPPGISKIAWLIEPPSISDTHYKTALRLRDEFDCILTFDRSYPERETDFMFYALGGSWIDQGSFAVHEKYKLVSIVGTDKMRAEGHKLRHAIIGLYSDRLGVYGRGYRPISTKAIALAPYRYSIVVESCRLNDYFSEKLIDCLSQGTVPIYWGCNSIGEYFDTRGMIVFNHIDELGDILSGISPADYESRLKYIERNLELCQRYCCAEDWIYENYPFLFEACEDK